MKACLTPLNIFMNSYLKVLLFPTDSTRLSDNPYQLQVRLVGGSYPSQGRVEVYCNGQWGTICNRGGFGSTAAMTVCRQLGYAEARSSNHLYLWVIFLDRQIERSITRSSESMQLVLSITDHWSMCSHLTTSKLFNYLSIYLVWVSIAHLIK